MTVSRRLLCALWLVGCSAVIAEEAPTRIWVDSDPEATERVLEVLRTERVSEEIRFEGTPLEDVFARFEQRHGVPVVIDGPALDDLGLGLDQPIKARIPEGVVLSSAVRQVLEPHELAFVVKDGVFRVTTEDASVAPENVVVAVYPVLDLLYKGDYESILESIMTTVDVDTWAANGGGEGAEIAPYPARGALIVAQSTATHEKVYAVIEALRRTPVNPNPEPNRLGTLPANGGDGTGRRYLGTGRIYVEPEFFEGVHSIEQE